jgi:hypothetical protein
MISGRHIKAETDPEGTPPRPKDLDDLIQEKEEDLQVAEISHRNVSLDQNPRATLNERARKFLNLSPTDYLALEPGEKVADDFYFKKSFAPTSRTFSLLHHKK